MRRDNRTELPKVNFYDGQRVRESDLDAEQLHKDSRISNLALDFQGSGILELKPFEDYILLDTRNPGLYTEVGEENPSKLDIDAGNFDGKALELDRQPSDTEFGNRLEFSLYDTNSYGSTITKVMVVGRAFDGSVEGGILDYEILEFDGNETRITEKQYLSIVSIIFNNFSGGSGSSVANSAEDSVDLISANDGYLIVKETEPLRVYPRTATSYQTSSPNFALNNFIFKTLEAGDISEDSLGLGSSDSLGDLYIDLGEIEEITFAEDASTAISYGQKFLAKSNNLQKINLLLALESGNTFSGSLVLSIHRLSTEISCPTDVAPDDLIDYDPEVSPITEISFDVGDLADLGIILGTTPTIVPFDFSDTLIADPNIDPVIEKDNYYAFKITRVGDTRTGSVVLYKGYTSSAGKAEQGVQQYLEEEFSKTTQRFFEFDPNTNRFVDEDGASLWYEVHSATVEVTSGIAYATDGFSVSVPKTQSFVGENQVANYIKDIDLADVSYQGSNYIILDHIQEFTDVETHPVSGNQVNVRIKDAAQVSAITTSDLNSLVNDDNIPLILAYVSNLNNASGASLTDTFNLAGTLGPNTATIIAPSVSLTGTNLIGRIFVPDNACGCDDRYLIVNTRLEEVLAGDLDNDGEITYSDLQLISDLAGNTSNSLITEKRFMNGDIDPVAFYQADLNQDQTVDGIDIELIEDAIDGYANFTTPEKFEVLYLDIENIDSSLNNPTVDASVIASTTAGESTVTATFLDEKDAFAARIGDKVFIPSTSVDSGTYIISAKSLDLDTLIATLTVTDSNGETVSFVGDAAITASILSGTSTHIFANNKDLLTVPYDSFTFEISFSRANFKRRFISVCDLRRFTNSSFLELSTDPDCGCEGDQHSCSPVYKNQTYIGGDIYLPNGHIYTEPGTPHPGDFEYTNISMPIPPGTIDDCSLDLYNTFIKAETGSCLTAAGYPAMKYSDGSYVGCDDSGADTDISKGRVKFSKAISSLYVDSLIDGYEVDGYSDLTISSTENGLIFEDFELSEHTNFSTWSADAGSSSPPFTINTAGDPALFSLTTSSVASELYGKLNGPSVIYPNTSGNFIIDFEGSRTSWPASSLIAGQVFLGGRVKITNLDGSVATYDLGWEITGNGTTNFYFRGIKLDSGASVLDAFTYSTPATETIGDTVKFRFRRVNDVVQAFYYVPSIFDADSIASYGNYIRIGENPSVQAGDQAAEFSLLMIQRNNPTNGLAFSGSFDYARVKQELTINSSLADTDTMELKKDPVSFETSEALFAIPINLTRRTVLLSAELILTSAESATITEEFRVLPMDVVDLSNLTSISNIPESDTTSLYVDFAPGTVTTSQEVSVDVTDIVIAYLADQSHLPGHTKGFLLRPLDDNAAGWTIEANATLNIAYRDDTTGVIFKVGISIDPTTGVATFNTQNVLYDVLIEENRTVVNFGVYLKKSGFQNSNIELTIDDLSRLGLGTCQDATAFDEEDECFFIAGPTDGGLYVEGPFPCSFIYS